MNIDLIIADSEYYVNECKSKSNKQGIVGIAAVVVLILITSIILSMTYNSDTKSTRTTESEQVVETKKYEIRYDENLPKRYFTDDEFNEILGMFQELSVKLSGNSDCKYEIVREVLWDHDHYNINNFNGRSVVTICRNADTIGLVKYMTLTDDLKYCKSLSKIIRISAWYDHYMTRKEANRLYNYLHNDYKNNEKLMIKENNIL